MIMIKQKDIFEYTRYFLSMVTILYYISAFKNIHFPIYQIL